MEQNMTPEDSAFVDNTTRAGMKIIYESDDGFKAISRDMAREDVEISKRLATATTGLMKVLMDKSDGKMPRRIIIPVARRLLLDIALFMFEAGIAKPSGEDISQADAILIKLIKKVFPAGGQAKPQAPQPAPQQTPQQAQPAPQQMPPQPAPQGGLLTQGV